MILIISTILTLLIIAYAIYSKDGFHLIWLLFPVIYGYSILGLLIPVNTVREKVIVSSFCSKELGECRLLVNGSVYTVNDYSMVSYFSITPTDTCTLILHNDSYGATLNAELELSNLSTSKLEK